MPSSPYVPVVPATDAFVGERAAVGRQPSAAVEARVVVRDDLAVAGAHDEDGLSPIVYSTKSPGAATSSSRHAICQTCAQRCSRSRFEEGLRGVALFGDEAVVTHEASTRGRSSLQNRQRRGPHVQHRRPVRARRGLCPRPRRLWSGVHRPRTASSKSNRPALPMASIADSAWGPATTSASISTTASSTSRRCSPASSCGPCRST